MEKRKLQCTAAKYVMWAFAWNITLSCITQSSITEVITIILLHLYNLMFFAVVPPEDGHVKARNMSRIVM